MTTRLTFAHPTQPTRQPNIVGNQKAVGKPIFDGFNDNAINFCPPYATSLPTKSSPPCPLCLCGEILNFQDTALPCLPIEINPNFAEAYKNRGLAYYFLDENEKAIADFTKAIEINPQDAAAYACRGIAYQELGKTEKVKADFQKYNQLSKK